MDAEQLASSEQATSGGLGSHGWRQDVAALLDASAEGTPPRGRRSTTASAPAAGRAGVTTPGHAASRTTPGCGWPTDPTPLLNVPLHVDRRDG